MRASAPEEPPVPLNAKGEPRRVGMEFEFGGIDTETAATAVAGALGGTLRRRDPHRFTIEAEGIGSVTVELDTRWAHPEKIREMTGSEPGGPDDLPDWLADLFGSLAGAVMPVEVIAPPIPWHDLPKLTPVLDALGKAGATGTEHSNFSGFGTHFNIEAWDLSAEGLLAMLRAYVLSAAWLRRDIGLATIRKLQSYIDPFTVDYARLILDPHYTPDLRGLIREHIRWNPSRNRELDMLPIFAHLEPDLVRRLLPGEKIGARPAFHWRLPDCRVDEPWWDWLADWNRWIAVERLATDPDRLASLGRGYLETGPRSEFEARIGRILDAFA